jgi:hypothetical protein
MFEAAAHYVELVVRSSAMVALSRSPGLLDTSNASYLASRDIGGVVLVCGFLPLSAGFRLNGYSFPVDERPAGQTDRQTDRQTHLRGSTQRSGRPTTMEGSGKAKTRTRRSCYSGLLVCRLLEALCSKA